MGASLVKVGAGGEHVEEPFARLTVDFVERPVEERGHADGHEMVAFRVERAGLS